MDAQAVEGHARNRRMSAEEIAKIGVQVYSADLDQGRNVRPSLMAHYQSVDENVNAGINRNLKPIELNRALEPLPQVILGTLLGYAMQSRRDGVERGDESDEKHRQAADDPGTQNRVAYFHGSLVRIASARTWDLSIAWRQKQPTTPRRFPGFTVAAASRRYGERSFRD